MKMLIISSSLASNSRSEMVARRCQDVLLEFGAETTFMSLKEYVLPPFGLADFQDDPAYRFLHTAVLHADGLILASPIYNWSSCAEMKKFIEYVGATNGSVRGAFYDKVITFVSAAGLPHSYMAVAPVAMSMMLDFKCIINPFNVYVHDRHWDGSSLAEEAQDRLHKSMNVMMELTTLLSKRTYRSNWEI